MKPSIELYYSSICELCHKSLEFLMERGLDFEAHCIGYDPETDAWLPSDNLTELEGRIGSFEFVPHIFINGTHVAGWKKLKPMIDSGEFDQLLAGE